MTIKTKPQTHTPRPWTVYRIEQRRGFCKWQVRANDDGLFGEYSFSVTLLRESDARLIAAAPELLEAAKMARTVLGELRGGPHEEPTVLHALCDAITEAEGQEVQ